MKFLILIFVSSLAYGQQKQSDKLAAKIPEKFHLHVNLSSGQSIPFNENQTIFWNNIVSSSDSSAFNDGIWTAQKTGVYTINAHGLLDCATQFDLDEYYFLRVRVQKSGQPLQDLAVCSRSYGITGSSFYNASSTCNITTKVEAGDQIYIQASQTTNSARPIFPGANNYFTVIEH